MREKKQSLECACANCTTCTMKYNERQTNDENERKLNGTNAEKKGTPGAYHLRNNTYTHLFTFQYPSSGGGGTQRPPPPPHEIHSHGPWMRK